MNMKMKYDIWGYTLTLGPFIAGIGMGMSLYEDNLILWPTVVLLGMMIAILGSLFAYRTGLYEFLHIRLQRELISASNEISE